jgi:uncharacterized protein (TIGR03437 family)
MAVSIAIALFVVAAHAQPARAQARRNLTGQIHPLARVENDRGRVSPALQLSYVTLTLAQSESQQADLDQLLAEQQTPGSPNYHHWLSPEEYAQRFGASEADVNKVVAWLQGQGLTIAAVARGRNWIAVNGPAPQIESTFQTEIHEYVLNGESHFANATEPSVPAELGSIIRTIHGLHDFRPRPSRHILKPAYTGSRGSHYLAPNDFATIYDVTPLYAANITGSGQKLVVAGQTQITLSDIEQFRTNFGLPANDPQTVLVPGSRDPGTSSTDVPEADLDLEWAGAVARNASILYVYSFDVMVAVQYAIDQNLAPVVSSSYGSCELETPSSDALALRSLAKQANAQGITWISSSGDSGGPDCDDSQNPGLSVDIPSSIPEVTGLGGTEFVEGGDTYWRATNDSSQASALSYIPEMVWNDSVSDGEPSAGGGGVSIYFTKPTWQTGPGVPSDNSRHTPDISLTASADHDGYMVYTGGSLQIYGGTSVPAPAFAGIAALLNQYLVTSGAQSTAGLGNMNPALYSLAQTAPSAFHDITSGNNIATVVCSSRSRVCSSSPVGYNAGAGYDNASGLGSIDAYKLVTKWTNQSAPPPPANASITLLSNLTTFGTSDTVFITATATGTGGVTPVGVVQFQAGNALLGSAALVGSAGFASATITVSGTQFSIGSATVTAVYAPSGSSSASASITVSVKPASASVGTPSIAGVANGASFTQAVSPGAILSVFGSQLAPSAASASSVPLPISMAGVAATVNGVAAPLYYVSAGQLNIQIPYETSAGSATLSVNNNGQVTSKIFNVSAAAPGVFFNSQNGLIVPTGSATRGQIITLFITGAGSVTPAIATGAAPASGTAIANLPRPSQAVTVMVGGVAAASEFVGIPVGLVGVTQINFQVPTSIGIGTQPVVVIAGGVSSPAAHLSVTN